MILVTVIVCAHNPRPHYLQRVLDALRAQTLPLPKWELLLVDNASAEPLAGRVDISWHPNGRHIREASLGLTHARLRGIAEAAADLLVFVDDDNVLKSDYLEHAQAIAAANPNLGVWSGSVRLEFEQSPAEWTKPYWDWLTAREVSEDVQFRSDTDSPNTPYGAGMCVRRQVALQYREQLLHSPERQAFGRKGASLTSAEDVDIALTACDMELDLGLFARLHVTHLIPPQRLTEEYLLRLRRGVMMSLWLLRFIRGKRLSRLPQGLKWWIKFLYDGMRKRGRARRFYMAEVLGKRDAWKTFAALERISETPNRSRSHPEQREHAQLR
jgi:glycosyltransferase involved in cell wall biosynthesis